MLSSDKILVSKQILSLKPTSPKFIGTLGHQNEVNSSEIIEKIHYSMINDRKVCESAEIVGMPVELGVAIAHN